jgi:16S rRNA (cytidine1402-2'-O)-methyltransferase
LKDEVRTMIFYVSPYKLVKTLAEFKTYFGSDRQVSVSRELTKMFEETARGTLEEVEQHFLNKPPKGEIVMILAGKGKE